LLETGGKDGGRRAESWGKKERLLRCFNCNSSVVLFQSFCSFPKSFPPGVSNCWGSRWVGWAFPARCYFLHLRWLTGNAHQLRLPLMGIAHQRAAFGILERSRALPTLHRMALK